MDHHNIPIKFRDGMGSADILIVRELSPVWRAHIDGTWDKQQPISVGDVTEADFQRLANIYMGDGSTMTPIEVIRLLILVDMYQISDKVLHHLCNEFDTASLFPVDIMAFCDDDTLVGQLPHEFADNLLLPKVLEVITPRTVIRSPTIAALVEGNERWASSTGLHWHFPRREQPVKAMRIIGDSLAFDALSIIDRPSPFAPQLTITSMHALDDARRVLCVGTHRINPYGTRTIIAEMDIVDGRFVQLRKFEGAVKVLLNARSLFAVEDQEIHVYDRATLFQQGSSYSMIVKDEFDTAFVFGDKLCVFDMETLSVLDENNTPQWSLDTRGITTCIHGEFVTEDRLLLSGFGTDNDLCIMAFHPSFVQRTIAGCEPSQIGKFCVHDGLIYQHVQRRIEILNEQDLTPVRSIDDVVALNLSLALHGSVVLLINPRPPPSFELGAFDPRTGTTRTIRHKSAIDKGDNAMIVGWVLMPSKVVLIDRKGCVYVLSR